MALVRVYQLAISPLLPPSCRFHPTCSQYSIEALRTHGAVKGIGLTAWRLLRCHPFHPGGYDPVPPRAAGSWLERLHLPTWLHLHPPGRN